MAKSDYYETLGVKRGATEDEIQKSYRRLARKYHPDLNPGDKSAEDRFKSVQEAYDILKDEKKRKMYDQYGFYSDSGMPGPGHAPHQDGPGMGFGGFDFSDFVNQQNARTAERDRATDAAGGGGFRDIFSQFFNRGAAGAESPAPTPQKGSDLEYALSIDFWQSIKGTQAKFNIARQETCEKCGGTGSGSGQSTTCPECEGTGNVTQMAGNMKFTLNCPKCGGKGILRNVCPQCHGDGRLSHQEPIEVRIPAGAQSGSRLRVAGKGNAGTMGGASGDLYITVRVEDHPFFHRDGDNIEIKVPVSVTEAGLGAKIEVPTIDGRALLKIPQGTQNGQKFRLREKGILNARKNLRGDQIVEVAIQAPNVQDERTRELLRELAQIQTEDPRAELWSRV